MNFELWLEVVIFGGNNDSKIIIYHGRKGEKMDDFNKLNLCRE